ncbi:hypothetical protein [Sporosarcina sp. G11-34]|uniref:hypothetical protein n=1 Tax=Sporosarcina sp. G11-34 TaxID=2849605 RepID=UPI0022A9CE2E|nr:hypothetical protein [Sporosarcina sp. G11-34]MCZ2257342.1 hypothetical protein [Sporosarcina sp. G11-34]
MGELIFSVCYGSSLIVMGFVTKGFLKKMEREAREAESTESIGSVKTASNYKEVV